MTDTTTDPGTSAGGFTVVEALAFEEVAGCTLPVAMATAAGGNPTAAQMLALVWIFRARQDPKTTVDDVRGGLTYAQLRDEWAALTGNRDEGTGPEGG